MILLRILCHLYLGKVYRIVSNFAFFASLSQDAKNRKHFSELSVILKEGRESIEVFDSELAKFDRFIKSKVKVLDSDYETSYYSGRVLDSQGRILSSRIVKMASSIGCASVPNGGHSILLNLDIFDLYALVGLKPRLA